MLVRHCDKHSAVPVFRPCLRLCFICCHYNSHSVAFRVPGGLQQGSCFVDTRGSMARISMHCERAFSKNYGVSPFVCSTQTMYKSLSITGTTLDTMGMTQCSKACKLCEPLSRTIAKTFDWKICKTHSKTLHTNRCCVPLSLTDWVRYDLPGTFHGYVFMFAV